MKTSVNQIQTGKKSPSMFLRILAILILSVRPFCNKLKIVVKKVNTFIEITLALLFIGGIICSIVAVIWLVFYIFTNY